MGDDESSLRIGQFQGEYRVASTKGNATAIATRLDRVLRDQLPIALEEAFSFPASDRSVLKIRALDLDVMVDESADDSTIARAVATQLRRRVEALVARPNSRVMRRYDDRAHYYAAFLADVMSGRADQAWEYAELDGLRALPISSRIRTALLREADYTRAILRRLARNGALLAVLRGLTAPAARDVLTELSRATSAATSTMQAPVVDDELVLRATDAWRRVVPVVARAHDPRNLLLLALESSSTPGGAGDAGEGPLPVHALGALLRVGEALSSRPSEEAALLSWLQRRMRRLPPRPESVRAPASWLADRAIWERSSVAPAALEGWARAVVGTPPGAESKADSKIESGSSAPSSTATGAPKVREPGQANAQRRATDFGFAFLLLSELAELGIQDANQRRLLLCAAAGREKRPRAARDPVLAWLAGLERLDEVDEGGSQEVLAPIVAQLRQRRLVRGRVLVEEVGDEGATVHLARDLFDDVWVDADPSRDALFGRLASRGFERVHERSEEARAAARRRRPSLPDLQYLAGPEIDVELARSLATHAVVRCFARRLMGFGWSGLSHLAANFFPGPTSAQIAAGRIDVTLPPVPLGLVLQVAGYHGRMRNIPWLSRDLYVRLG